MIEGKFRVIAADPPWNFKAHADQAKNRLRRDAGRYYEVMDFGALCDLPVRKAAAADCHLFLWSTGPHLPQALNLMRSWDFKYSGIAFTWIKLKKSECPGHLSNVHTGYDVVKDIEARLHIGMGFTTRKNAEFCLLGRKGKPSRESKNVREVIVAPRREHSRKPDEFFDRVEAYSRGPYCELFARETRPGWSSWGDETTKFG